MTDVLNLLYLCLLESCHSQDRCVCGTVNAGIHGKLLPARSFPRGTVAGMAGVLATPELPKATCAL